MSKRTARFNRGLAYGLLLSLIAPGLVWAQESGPITAPPKRETRRISREATPEAPPIPLEEILKQVLAHDAEGLRQRALASYRLSIKLQEFGDKGLIGEAESLREIRVLPDGRRQVRRMETPDSTLKLLEFSKEELDRIFDLPPFVLLPETVSLYDITYAGKQPVDELQTYVLRIKPKSLTRQQRRFEGLLYVDDRDLSIVKSYGRFITEVPRDPEAEPFEFVETYRENVGPQLWLPSFSRSESELRRKEADIRIRLTIRYTDYKLAPSPAPAK